MMKYTMFIIAVMLGSCCDHNCQVNKKFPKLKRPIIVVSKKCNDSFGCSVLVRDKNDSILFMGNMSALGNSIGSNYNIGDTLK